MTLNLTPDAEQLIGGYLRDHPDLGTLGVKVVGEIPSDFRTPIIRLTQLDDLDASNVEYLFDFLLQLDCYAGSDAQTAHTGQAEAWIVARTARAVLKALHPQAPGYAGQVIDGVTITSVTFTNMARIPDTGFEPARQRVVLDARIYMHRS